jgi:hypothetical protein
MSYIDISAHNQEFDTTENLENFSQVLFLR